MKKFLGENESFKEIYSMFTGLTRSKLLLAGIEMKVFNHLTEPKSADAVAEAIDAHPGNTRVILDGLTACDLVVKKNDLYYNAPAAQTFLVEGSPTFIGQTLTSWVQMGCASLNDIPKLVKEGPPSFSPEAHLGSEEMWAQITVSNANYQRAGVQQAVRAVSELPEFSSFKKMLDLGGGPGVLGIAIVSAHPSMKGLIFDTAEVVKIAKTFIEEYEADNRMEVMAGDYLSDSIGDGYDLIWASNTLWFAKDNLDPLIKKIYDALNPGGVFISFHEGLTDERTKPDLVALSYVPVALMGQDMRFDQGFIADSMLRVGFKSVSSRTLDTGWGPMDLDIGRKKERGSGIGE